MATPTTVSSRQIQADACRAKAYGLLERANFSKEDASRAQGYLDLAQQLDLRGEASRLMRASLTESEASAGIRTSRTRTLDSVRADFYQAVRGGIYALDTDDPARRALAAGVDSSGGYLIPASLSDSIYSMMAGIDKLFDPSVVTVVTTGDGGSFSIPLDNDIAGAGGAIVAENLVFAEAQDIGYEALVLGKAPTWRADLLRASTELVQDVGFDLEAYLADRFSLRLRKCVGASLFATLVSQSTKAVDAAATTLSVDNVRDLIDAVDESYTASPKCGFLMRRSTLTAIRKLRDSQQRPVFKIERDDAGRFLLEGFPVFLSPSADAIGTTKKSVLFGDCGRFIVRVVADGMKLRVLRERFITQGQYGFLMWARVHGGLAKFSSAPSPIQYIQHA